ncbi:NAD(P)-dependent oxidoreductase [Paraburkholderia phymatum]|uniref:6-phosphogluconate dehydrogenase NAD-binding n=1 Tax=Paraburkholderia phymatum (strain DSM 17167 / CIP 108236 / LMG 21445 / STM815) TaxID=391038 RepID=B2JTE6_PARP8|nr:NAD(P)-dependent oxidoreductase [Paraburkholderia phymatum]ACC75849.1 6-phosphogluconate dehydrogenase NAD-binding [Paraburkholderia phymatum STM815]
MRIGYIGLGAMGGALARHLIGKYPLSVFDLNRKAVEAFVELGATAAATPAELARNSDVVLLCLPRSSDVHSVLFGPDGAVEGLSDGKIVIDQTSGVPAETRDFARQLADIGVALFDAPVSGAMATAIAGTISIIASGPKDAFEKTLPVLQSISPNVFHCGERVGNGQTMKTVNNMMNVSCRLATLEVVAMGRKFGLPLELMTEAINATTARNYTSQGMLPAIAEGRQSTKFWLALQVKDIHQAITLAAEQKVPMPIGAVARSILQIGLNSLGKDAQLEQMIGVIESMADTKFVGAPSASASKEVA